MVNFDRLGLKQILTTGRPQWGPDHRSRFPIFSVERILPDTREVMVVDRTNGENRILSEKDLQTMFPVEVSLGYLHSQVYGSRRKQESEMSGLFLAICLEAVKNNPEFLVYLKEMREPEPSPEAIRKFLGEMAKTVSQNPQIQKAAKAALQGMLERQTRSDVSAFNFKQRGIADRDRKGLDKKTRKVYNATLITE